MNALKLHQHDPELPPPHGDAVTSWLDLLEKLLRLPPEETRGIRDELASHLRERVRDLTVSGMPDAEATRTAIGELGDAAELARRFQHARGHSKRSTVMQIALVSAVVVALTAGGLALRGASQAEDARQQAAAAKQAELEARNKALQTLSAAVLASDTAPATAENALARTLDATVAQSSLSARRAALSALLSSTTGDGVGSAKVSAGPTDTWKTFFENAAKAAGKSPAVNFPSMETLTVSPDGPLGLELKDVTLDDAVRLLNDARPGDRAQGRFTYRAGETTLEFASEDYFDRREVETRTYDLDTLVKDLLAKEAEEPAPKEGERHSRTSAEQSVCEEVSHLISEMVNPNMWTDNGGDIASIRRFGSKLFVTAPARRFKDIEWILKEAGAFEKARAAAAPEARKLSVTVDPQTRQLVITDGAGATIHCASLTLASPEVIAPVLDSAQVETHLPVLSDLPIINHGFTQVAPLRLLLESRADGSTVVHPAGVSTATESGTR
ncbi:MAG: permease prefix domain 1-containing protein [Phycisphaerales bacterium]